MYFTLAVSATAPGECAAMVRRACTVDPRIMPIPGPPRVAWRAPDGSAAMIIWGDDAESVGAQSTGNGSTGNGSTGGSVASYAGTIRASADGATVFARTSITRVDPVYLARRPGVVVLSDRATWAAAVTGRLGDSDPVMVAAFINLGFPLDGATPFAGVRALDRETSAQVTSGVARESHERAESLRTNAASSEVAAALVASVAWLQGASVPVRLGLTGGKDSRLIAAALVAAGVPVIARTHGFGDHPDVVVARMVADRLGIEHIVTEPAVTPSTRSSPAVQEVDVLSRLRATVLVSDGMLSAFENVGRPDPETDKSTIEAGGHGGELLRGGYAAAIAGHARSLPQATQQQLTSLLFTRPALVAGRARRAAGSAELLRRLTTRRLRLLRPEYRARYLASLTPWAVALARGPQHALDDFYLANRAGRWSSAARQAFTIRSTLIQPFFDDRVVRAARSVPLGDRVNDRLQYDVLAELCPALLEIPLASDQWKCDAGKTQTAGHNGASAASPPNATSKPRGGRAAFDWRRSYGNEVSNFLRDYVLDAGDPLFEIVSKQTAERLLYPPHTSPAAIWSLATLAALTSQDWLNARNSSTYTFKIPAQSR
jgi:asparagine synthetase B (glutamine-hydrolysing)